MINIKKATDKDINAICKAHLKIFDKSHLTSNFSDSLLKKYFAKLISMNEFNFVAYDERENLVGYILSGYHTEEAANEFMFENIFKIIIVLLKHPGFLVEKIIYSFYKRRKKKAPLRLLIIGVMPGLGLGRKLILHYENEIIKNGIREYGLSVRKDNARAANFYTKNGFILESKVYNSLGYFKKLKK